LHTSADSRQPTVTFAATINYLIDPFHALARKGETSTKTIFHTFSQQTEKQFYAFSIDNLLAFVPRNTDGYADRAATCPCSRY
jgi:hypothetical protein